MMIKKETIFRLGQLEVFSVTDLNDVYLPYPTIFYYWKDITTVTSQSHGPFNTINAAVVHYQNLLTAVKDSENNPNEATIIRADFASKRRLDP